MEKRNSLQYYHKRTLATEGPLSEVAKKSDALNILNESKDLISNRLTDLNEQRSSLLKQDDYDKDKLNSVNSDITNMNSALDQVNKGIEKINSLPDDDSDK